MFSYWAGHERTRPRMCRSAARAVSSPNVADRLQHDLPAGRVDARRRLIWFVVCVLCCAVSVCVPIARGVRADDGDEDPRPRLLFSADLFPKGWVSYSAEKETDLFDVWSARKGESADADVLVCRGKPFGYLRTETEYDDFEFSLEWNYPNDPNCNSGILVYTGEADKIWPTSMQVQLHRPTAGSVFPIGMARSDNTVDIKAGELPIAQWHACVVRSEKGRITVTINGNKVGEVTGCAPHKGYIALQSEGSEIRFRRITVKRLR